MSHFVPVDFATATGLSFREAAFAPHLDTMALSKPQLSYALIEDGWVRACFSLWTQNTPRIEDRPAICLGHIYAEDLDLGHEVLKTAVDIITHKGMDGPLIGPMDGSTWFSYRLSLELGDTPPFFLERFTAPFWPAVFEAQGFEILARYRSSITDNLRYHDRSAQVWADKIEACGIHVRAFDLANPEAELRGLHGLSLKSFAKNLFYTPVSEPDFLTLYAPILKVLIPDFVLMAYEGDQVAGFVFAVPDYAQKQRGEAVDTLIVKTLAVRPGRAYAGLGAYLAKCVHVRAAAAGFKRAIHAYMYEGNVSRIISDKSAQTLRTYGLYVRS
jgi:hypothetical protein